MSQPNRLIHSSGLLSFIRCNTDHERTPVSPVIPPLLFLHLSYMTCSHSCSAGDPENFTRNSESGQKYKNSAFPNQHFLFNRMQFICSSEKNNATKITLFWLQKLGTCGNTDIEEYVRQHLKNLTYISLSITPSILYQHCHSLTWLWCCLSLQSAFGLHAIAGKVE